MLIQIIHLTASQRDEWNTFAAREPAFALLQSWGWGEFKEKLGWKAFRIAAQENGQIVAGAQLLIKPLPFQLASVAYIPRGPIGNWLDPEIAPLLLSEIHQVCRRNKVIFLKIEPPFLNDPAIDQAIRQSHFRRSPYTNQPRATITLDLTLDLNQILKQMRERTRYYIKSAARHGVTRMGSYTDLAGFYDLMKETAQRGGFSPRTLDYYEKVWQTFADKNQTVLLMAFLQDQLLAVHMAFRFGKHAAYFHGASSNCSAPWHPNYMLMWEALKWAKAQGCHTFDLWGIPDEVGEITCSGAEPPKTDRTDGLWGVYRFKRGFSKKIVFYVGAYDYVYQPFLYKFLTIGLVHANDLEQVSIWLDALGTRAP